MDKRKLHQEILDKYGEWIEMSEDSNAVMVEILLNLLIKERAQNEYYSRRLPHA